MAAGAGRAMILLVLRRKEEDMFRTVVIGFDGSEQGRDALALARALGGPEAKMIAACVYPYEPAHTGAPVANLDYERSLREAAEAVLSQADGASETRVIPCGSPARGLHDLAEEVGADLIVAGSTHHGAVGKVIVGSVGEKLLQGSPCPVAIAPKGFASEAARPFETIAIAYDGSPESEQALALATLLAQRSGSAVRLFTAVPSLARESAMFPSEDGWSRHREKLLSRTQERLDAAVRSVPETLDADGVLLYGAPAEAIADKARESADVLVMGSRGYGKVRGVFLGRVSAELARSAPCPMIVAPRGAAIPREVALAAR
jgi:nucleotide-binding universal stress UspA family protein